MAISVNLFLAGLIQHNLKFGCELSYYVEIFWIVLTEALEVGLLVLMKFKTT